MLAPSLCSGDDSDCQGSASGKSVPTFGSVLGNTTAGGGVNRYHPRSDRGAGLTVLLASSSHRNHLISYDTYFACKRGRHLHPWG